MVVICVISLFDASWTQPVALLSEGCSLTGNHKSSAAINKGIKDRDMASRIERFTLYQPGMNIIGSDDQNQ